MRDHEARCPINLSSAATYGAVLPHEELTALRRETPVFWHEAGPEGGYWAVLKHAEIVEVSRNNELYSSAARGVFYEDRREAMTGSLLLLDPPQHMRERAIVERAFVVDAMKDLEGWMRGKARALVDRAADLRACEFVYDLAAELPLAAISELVGVPEADRRAFLQMGDDVVRSGSKDRFTAAMRGLEAYGIELSRNNPDKTGASLLSKLAEDPDGGRQSEALFGKRFAQIAVAANETTRTLLSCTILELIERPDVYADLRRNPDLIPSAIEEFLRWTTPIYYMRRTATADTELRGVPIRAGDAVVMYYISANRDEDVFDAPFTLDIRRRPNRHLSFGVGRHVCLGQFLARLETRVFLEEFLARFSGVALTGAPKRLGSPTTNSWDRIPIALESA